MNKIYNSNEKSNSQQLPRGSVIINFKKPREKNKLKSTNYLCVCNVAMIVVIVVVSVRVIYSYIFFLYLLHYFIVLAIHLVLNVFLSFSVEIPKTLFCLCFHNFTVVSYNFGIHRDILRLLITESISRHKAVCQAKFRPQHAVCLIILVTKRIRCSRES